MAAPNTSLGETMRRFSLAAFLLVSASTAALAQAPRYDPLGVPLRSEDQQGPAGFEEHDGFFLRFLVGPGVLSAKADVNDPIFGSFDMTMGGAAAGLSFDIGGAVAENLILFAALGGVSVTNPTLKVEADGQSMEETAEGVTLQQSHVGIGLQYFVMPLNLYVGGDVGFAQLVVRDQDSTDTTESDLGFYGSVIAGKEWWVSDNWGLGVAARLGMASIPDKEASDLTWNTFTGTVGFSATYN